MRELKFRAWDGERMWTPDFISAVGKPVMRSALKGKANVYDNPVMQFTGIKDAKGIEIFEGDIVQCVKHSMYAREVVFRDGNYWLINPDRKMDFEIQVVLTSHEETTIVGNVYENPELLKNQ